MKIPDALLREYFYRLGGGRAHLPVAATVEVDYRCMFSCRTCMMSSTGFRESRIGDKKVLSTSEMKDAISGLAGNGVKLIHFC